MWGTWRTRTVAAAVVLMAGTGAVGIAQAATGTAGLSAATTLATATTVDSTLAKNLQFTREEERMARDLYAALATKYDDAMPFSRITQSEQQHFDMVGAMLTDLGVSDPAKGRAAGSYAYPEIQKLYDGWLKQGSGSRDAAYDVGVALEKRDIADLTRIIAATKDANATTLFTRLRTASEHHLTAFQAWADGKVTEETMGTGQGMGRGRGGGGRMGGGMMGGAGPAERPDGWMGRRGGNGPGQGTGQCWQDETSDTQNSQNPTT